MFSTVFAPVESSVSLLVCWFDLFSSETNDQKEVKGERKRWSNKDQAQTNLKQMKKREKSRKGREAVVSLGLGVGFVGFVSCVHARCLALNLSERKVVDISQRKEKTTKKV